jgi:hypothetical protein
LFAIADWLAEHEAYVGDEVKEGYLSLIDGLRAHAAVVSRLSGALIGLLFEFLDRIEEPTDGEETAVRAVVAALREADGDVRWLPERWRPEGVEPEAEAVWDYTLDRHAVQAILRVQERLSNPKTLRPGEKFDLGKALWLAMRHAQPAVEP